MPRDLFGDVSDPSVRVGSRKWYTVPLSLFVHTIVLLLVVVIPLVATGALPDPRNVLTDEPALAAVRQWIYTPTTLNGVAVPVIMTVTVNFQLQ
jgi:hypothetical protein